jgi:hypothetical protein
VGRWAVVEEAKGWSSSKRLPLQPQRQAPHQTLTNLKLFFCQSLKLAQPCELLQRCPDDARILIPRALWELGRVVVSRLGRRPAGPCQRHTLASGSRKLPEWMQLSRVHDRDSSTCGDDFRAGELGSRTSADLVSELTRRQRSNSIDALKRRTAVCWQSRN